MALDEGGCDNCPLLASDPTPTRTNKVCVKAIEYPFSLVEMNPRIEVEVESEEALPFALTEFTRKVFEVLGRPGVHLHPRAFLRAVVGGKRQRVCAASWPTPMWARLIIEQISFDTAGMQPRLLYNDLPWLAQPAIYTQCYGIVLHAKSVAQEWLDDAKKRKGST